MSQYKIVLTCGFLLSCISFSTLAADDASQAAAKQDTQVETSSSSLAEKAEQKTEQIAEEQPDGKLSEDPTKVVTQIGIGYSDKFKVSGSISLGPVNKINANVSLDGDEWRIGGSWLFKLGIVNVNFGRKDFDHGAHQNNYSIGTFIPLSIVGFTPLGTQLFVMAGYSYNDGETACKGDCGQETVTSDWMLVSNETNTGYVGLFALKPITDKWTALAVGAYSAGSNSYSGYLVATGASYHITKQQTVIGYGLIQDNDYGDDQRLGIMYRYQFE